MDMKRPNYAKNLQFIQSQRLLVPVSSLRCFGKASKTGKGGKDSNKKDKKKAEEKAQIYEEFEGQDTDTVKDDFNDGLEVSNKTAACVFGY